MPYMQLSHMIPGMNIIGRKESVASVNRAGGGLGVVWDPSGAPKKTFRLKEHLDWFKKDLNAAEIITIQDYKHTQN